MWSVRADATVYQAIEIMADKRIGALLVLEGGKLVGIVSERDYARKSDLEGPVVERDSCTRNHEGASDLCSSGRFRR